MKQAPGRSYREHNNPDQTKHMCVYCNMFGRNSSVGRVKQRKCSFFAVIMLHQRRLCIYRGFGLISFYGPLTHFRSFRARSVNLATLFVGKPPRQFTCT